MARCNNCKNLETKDNGFDAYSWCEKINDCPHEDIERDCENYEPMINADRIRSMTDEELAMALLCVLRNLLKSDKVCDFNHDCKDCTLSWLQKESEGAMTENKAIEELHRIRPYGGIIPQRRVEALDVAIKALEEVQQYHQIGTVEECREAVEKQTAKKPDYEGDGFSDGQLVYDTWICPCCGKHYEVDCDRYYYCQNCGQHIDWSDEE